jgi:hypothetical protein
MQLTIDSEQPLDEVLRVVGAMFDVEISVGSQDARAATRPGRAARQATKRAGSARRGARRGGRRARSGATPADVRQWAALNGLEIASKGRVPGSVLEAFAAAHR